MRDEEACASCVCVYPFFLVVVAQITGGGGGGGGEERLVWTEGWDDTKYNR